MIDDGRGFRPRDIPPQRNTPIRDEPQSGLVENEWGWVESVRMTPLQEMAWNQAVRETQFLADKRRAEFDQWLRDWKDQ